MSYLDYPRLHFSGGFLADPSTINNAPNNYSNTNSAINQLELYWNPNGTGIFDLQNCVVTKVVYGPGDETSDCAVDPIIGQPVIALYTSAAPKLVDLDPDQQNVSEIWGMTMQVAGISANPDSIPDFVRGDYVAGSFNAIWVQAQNGPHSSASGSGVYESTLINLIWAANTTPQSKFLTQLQAASPEQLSVNFTVNAHNNAPVIYIFSAETLRNCVNAGVPAEVVAKLQPMTQYFMNYDSKTMQPKKPGHVPTASYVNSQLNLLLGQADANTYGATILAQTLDILSQSSDKMNTAFPTGLTNGTIGPKTNVSPVFYTPTRTMAPWNNAQLAYFAPFQTQQVGGNVQVTLNIGNALATNKPGYNEPDKDFGVFLKALGNLSVVYFDQGKGQEISVANAVPFAALPSDSASMAQLMKTSAGIIMLQVDPSLLPQGVTVAQANAAILSMPLGLIGQNANQPLATPPTIWCAENLQGYNLRADQFVFRMNPGVTSGPQQPYGDTAIVRLYATVFGQPAANCKIDTWLMSEADSIPYTSNTLGTSGTLGIKNVAIPQDALSFSDAQNGGGWNPVTGITTITTNAQGMAELKISATDPGFPRASQDLDGQIYFVQYNFNSPTLKAGFTQDANDLVSILLFSQQFFPATPTWDNCISNILPQYAKLYPIMGRFRLNDYDTVVQYQEAIRTVLARPMDDALHMPVIRDLSIARTQIVLQWFANGTPKN